MLSENSQTLLSVTLQMGGVHVTSLPPCWMIFTKDSPCLQFKDHPAWRKISLFFESLGIGGTPPIN